MKSIILIPICLIAFLFVDKDNSPSIDLEQQSVAALLEEYGLDYSAKLPRTDIPNVSAKAGEQLVKFGFAEKENGKKSGKQSKHFVCTSCHNVEREDEDLANPSPEDRLIYTDKKGIPFLQGTTLYGAVNRETYYNGDYEKKYGDLVIPARNNIREAIQLCATECAQGRKLADWEIESILAYLWTIDLKMGDLLFNGEELGLFAKDAVKTDPKILVEMITSKFKDHSDATFTKPPENRKEGYKGIEGDPSKGKLVYDNSCMHCHKNQRYSYFNLTDESLSFKYLNDKAGGYAPHSIYQVTRWGVKSKSGKRSYMPQYPKERLSDQMVEDLRAYIRSRS